MYLGEVSDVGDLEPDARCAGQAAGEQNAATGCSYIVLDGLTA
ncbi:hypothetical protein [Subtercola endophyticus]|nr:hypothetical protein [Subtercola endophyticus]